MPDERFEENQSELNQNAKRLLKKAKTEWSPEFLYSLQLAQWAVDQRNNGLREDLVPVLDDTVANLLGGKPSLSERWLLTDPDDRENPRVQPYQLEYVSPLEGSQVVLNAVYEKLKSFLPDMSRE